MLKKIIVFSLLAPLHTFAYELPIDGKGGFVDECNKYTNMKSDIFIKEHNIQFKTYSVHSGEKITENKEWNEINFKSALSAVCAIGYFHAKGNKSEADSVNWILQSNMYDTIYQSVNGEAEGEDVVWLIKNTVIFGHTLN